MNILFGFSCLVIVLSVTFMIIYNAQKMPYMDEIFHIPQANQYCIGNFSSWDPMITTLPGLYLISVGVLNPLQKVFNVNVEEVCSVLWLRMINILFAVGNFYLIYALVFKLHENEKSVMTRATISALTMSLLPLLYFFNFLYYTDVGSTFFVLFMYLLHLHDNKCVASLVGVIAIMFRQTNVIWVVFVTGLTAVDTLIDWANHQHAYLTTGNSKSDKHKSSRKKDYTISEIIDIFMKSLFNDLLCIFPLLLSILQTCFSYICIIIGFLAFVFWNKGIVVGDRSHHTACLNFPQLFYFILFTSFFAFPYFFIPSKIFAFLKDLATNYVKTLLFLCSAFISVYYFTYVHVYLLSDNRHFTFYIWARLFNRHFIIKYLMIPVYLCSYWVFIHLLQHKSSFWRLVYFISLFAATVPQKLLEFRYFIIPYLIFRLNIRQGSLLQLCIEFLLYVAINGATIYLFVNKPFKWESSSDLQRFMW